MIDAIWIIVCLVIWAVSLLYVYRFARTKGYLKGFEDGGKYVTNELKSFMETIADLEK